MVNMAALIFSSMRSIPAGILFLVSFVFFGLFSLGVADDSEVEALLKFKDSLENSGGLSSWNKLTNPDPCNGKTENWIGVLCANDEVWGLKLENLGLKGTIDTEALGNLKSLRTISLMNNSFDGQLPDISPISSLKSLYLSNNQFSGEVPSASFQGLVWLKKLYLENNQFVGAIPTTLVLLPKLVELTLQNNQFDGKLPEFQQRFLVFNVANNKLEGQIPLALTNLPPSSFSGNGGLCGTPLGSCQKGLSLGSEIVLGVSIVLAMIVILVAIFIFIRRKRTKEAGDFSSITLPRKSKAIQDDCPSRSGSDSASVSSRRGEMKLTFLRDDRPKFDLQELLRASAEILGSGYYSSSYKAGLTNGPMIVVKRFKQMNNLGREEFQEHMRRLGRLSNPNLLPIVAYYYRREEKLMVTDHVDNGSLAVRLHGHHALRQATLDWPTRVKIVKGIAKGLQYLYNELPSLVAPHGHLKSSNVLLNQSYEPLLADYGLIPVMNPEQAREMMVAYKSPEFLQHGRITKKTDIWSFGILLLEILTGQIPACFLTNGKANEQDIESWVSSVVPENWTNEIFDREMAGTSGCEEEMRNLLQIALSCCEADVDKRLDLKEVVARIHDQQVKEKDGDDHAGDETH